MKTANDFVKHYTAGRPTEYNKEKHIRILFDVFSKGEGVAAFLDEAAISKQTFYDWLKVHKEFKEAYEGALNRSQRMWELYPLNNPNFNFPYWSTMMRNRFGYGKPKIRIAKDATPLARIDSIWEGLEEGQLTGQEATQLASVVSTQANMLTDQPNESEQFKLETKEEIMAKVYAIQKVIEYKHEN